MRSTCFLQVIFLCFAIMSSTKSAVRSACPISCGLDVLGDKWTLLIIRDLLLSNRSEFGHLLNAGEGISTNILTDRLAQLQRNGLLVKENHPEHGKKFVYTLTQKGLSLAPVIVELALWADNNIEGARLPDVVRNSVEKDKSALLAKLMAGNTIFHFDL
jgi:DNA-binding HxlR family transcriptional regulator